MNSNTYRSGPDIQSSGQSPAVDFEELEAAVLETERGRWFLSEFARRLRAVETAEILTALERLTRRVVAYESFPREFGRTGEISAEGPEIHAAEEPTATHAKPSTRADLCERLAALKEIDAMNVEDKVALFA
jgi:hypothetical protein